MSLYLAKKIRLNTMEECRQPGCNCFTKNGYYIQYRNGNVDSVLFVCEHCFEEKFKSKCSIGDFDEDQYMVRPGKIRYQRLNPALRQLINWTYKTVRTLRIMLSATALILVTAFWIKEKPAVRSEFSRPHFHLDIKTHVHFEPHDLSHLESIEKSMKNQLVKVYTHGGKTND